MRNLNYFPVKPSWYFLMLFVVVLFTRFSWTTGCFNRFQSSIRKIDSVIEKSWDKSGSFCKFLPAETGSWKVVNECEEDLKLCTSSGSRLIHQSKTIVQLYLYCQIPSLDQFEKIPIYQSQSSFAHHHAPSILDQDKETKSNQDQDQEEKENEMESSKMITGLILNCSLFSGNNLEEFHNNKNNFHLRPSFFKYLINNTLNLQNVSQVVIENCGLTSIHPRAFDPFSVSLVQLSLRKNRLKSFPIFEQLPFLTILDLTHNQMTGLDPKFLIHALDGLKSSKQNTLKLYLEGNSWNCNCSMGWIKQKQSDTNLNESECTVLTLNKNGNEEFQEKKGGNQKRDQFSIQVCHLHKIMCHVPNLKREYFTTDVNQVDKYGIWLKDHNDFMNPPRGQFSTVPLNDFPLHKFLCPYNFLNNISIPNVTSEKCPSDCFCHHNQNQNQSVNIVDCSAVPEFSLDVVEIPQGVTILDLGGNPWLNHLKFDRFNWESLKDLHNLLMNDCQLTSVRSGIFLEHDIQIQVPPNLKQLHLENNKITGLNGEELTGLENLEELFLRNNKLENIALTTFHQLSKLKVLDLRGNQLVWLHEIPELLAGTKMGLKNVRLHPNPFVCDCRAGPHVRDWGEVYTYYNLHDNGVHGLKMEGELELHFPPDCNGKDKTKDRDEQMPILFFDIFYCPHQRDARRKLAAKN